MDSAELGSTFSTLSEQTPRTAAPHHLPPPEGKAAAAAGRGRAAHQPSSPFGARHQIDGRKIVRYKRGLRLAW